MDTTHQAFQKNYPMDKNPPRRGQAKNSKPRQGRKGPRNSKTSSIIKPNNTTQCQSANLASSSAKLQTEPRQKLDVKMRPPDHPMQLGTGEDLSTNMNVKPEDKGKTIRDFLHFCDIVLKYANYPNAFLNHKEEEVERREIKVEIKVESPLNSVGESAQGSMGSSSSSISSNGVEVEAEPGAGDYDESWGQITCWCGKPFAGRPMIECESCFVWLHLTCARVRKSNIPEHFKCSRCKPGRGRRKREVSGNSDDSASTSNNGVSNLPSSCKSPRHLHMSSVMNSSSSTDALNHSEFGIKSPTYYTQSCSSNGNGPFQLPVKPGVANRKIAKPRPRRPAINSASANTFENPTLLPLRLTITTNHNPPPFS